MNEEYTREDAEMKIQKLQKQLAKARKRNPNDATNRNVRAQHKINAQILKRLDRLEKLLSIKAYKKETK